MSLTLDFRQPHVKDSKLQHLRVSVSGLAESIARPAGDSNGSREMHTAGPPKRNEPSGARISPSSGNGTDESQPRKLAFAASESSEDSGLSTPQRRMCCNKGGRMFRVHILLLPVFIVAIGTVAVWWLDSIEHENNEASVLRALKREAISVKRRIEEGMQEQVRLVSYMAHNMKLRDLSDFSLPSNWDTVALGSQNFVQLSTMTAFLTRVHVNQTGSLVDFLATAYANNSLVNSSKFKDQGVVLWGDYIGCNNSRYVATDIVPAVLPYLTVLCVDFNSERVRGEAIGASIEHNSAAISRPLPSSGSASTTLVHIAHPVYDVNATFLTVEQRCNAAAGVVDSIMSVTGFARQWLRDASLVGTRIRVTGCWEQECLVVLACSVDEDANGEPAVSFEVTKSISSLHVKENVALPDGTSWTLEIEAFDKFAALNIPAKSPLFATSISFFAFLFCLSIVYTVSVHQRTESLADDFKKQAKSLTQDRRAAKMLARREKDFLAYVFHEARVPFNAVTLGIQSLRNLPGQSAEARHILSLMEDGAGQTISILNDVLDMQRVEQGTFTLNYAPFCPAELIKASIWSFSSVAGARHIRVTSDIRDGMVETWVLGDHRRLKQVLDNLLSNAIKYTGDRGDAKVLLYTGRLRTEEPSDIVPIDVDDGDPEQLTFTIEVVDNGRGIGEEDQENLFKPFVRAAKNETAGTGLGLCVAKAITQLHGGVIGCRSVLGEGSRFHITLPLQLSEAAPDDRSDSEHKDTAEIRAVLSRMDILLVEDSLVSRTLMGVVFRQHGVLGLEFACNGLEAVQKCAARLKGSQSKPVPTSETKSSSMLDTAEAAPNSNGMLIEAPNVPDAVVAISASGESRRTTNTSESVSAAARVSHVELCSESTSTADLSEDSVPTVQRSTRARLRRLKRAERNNGGQSQLTSTGASPPSSSDPTGDVGDSALLPTQRRRSFDLIIMDKTMPVMDGEQATIEIRALGIKTPIVFLTGNAFAEEREAFLRAGADGVLTKPFQSDAFFQALAELNDQGHFRHLQSSSPPT